MALRKPPACAPPLPLAARRCAAWIFSATRMASRPCATIMAFVRSIAAPSRAWPLAAASVEPAADSSPSRSAISAVRCSRSAVELAATDDTSGSVDFATLPTAAPKLVEGGDLSIQRAKSRLFTFASAAPASSFAVILRTASSPAIVLRPSLVFLVPGRRPAVGFADLAESHRFRFGIGEDFDAKDQLVGRRASNARAA